MEWTIQQAAKETGFSADTLRYYEKEGMLVPKRRENGYRYYIEGDIAALKNIAVMKYAQFSLSEMRSMEELQRRAPSAACNEVCKGILNEKLRELRQAIVNYQSIVTLLEELLPMIDTPDAFYRNENRVNEFIAKIYDDIRGGN